MLKYTDMTLLEYYAGQALAGTLASFAGPVGFASVSPEQHAKNAFKIGEEMLAEAVRRRQAGALKDAKSGWAPHTAAVKREEMRNAISRAEQSLPGWDQFGRCATDKGVYAVRTEPSAWGTTRWEVTLSITTKDRFSLPLVIAEGRASFEELWDRALQAAREDYAARVTKSR